MPFGGQAAPLTFQGMINSHSVAMLGNAVFADLDDFIIANKNPEAHLAILKVPFQSLQKADFKIKVSKCNPFKTKNKFLGHEVDGEGISTSDDKITAVKKFPKP